VRWGHSNSEGTPGASTVYPSFIAEVYNFNSEGPSWGDLSLEGQRTTMVTNLGASQIEAACLCFHIVGAGDYTIQEEEVKGKSQVHRNLVDSAVLDCRLRKVFSTKTAHRRSGIDRALVSTCLGGFQISPLRSLNPLFVRRVT